MCWAAFAPVNLARLIRKKLNWVLYASHALWARMATWCCILNSLAVTLSIEMLDQLGRACLFHIIFFSFSYPFFFFFFFPAWKIGLIGRRAEPPGRNRFRLFDAKRGGPSRQQPTRLNESSQTPTFFTPFVSPIRHSHLSPTHPPPTNLPLLLLSSFCRSIPPPSS